MQVRRNLAMVAGEVVKVLAVLQEGEGGKVIRNQLNPECEDQEGEIRRTRSGGRSRVSEVECEAVEVAPGVGWVSKSARSRRKGHDRNARPDLR